MNIRGLPFLCAFALFILGFQFLAIALNPLILATGHFDLVAQFASAGSVGSPLVDWMIDNRGGGGRGAVFASLLFALVWLPVVLWVVLSRFKGWMRYAVLGVFLIQVVGFSYDASTGGFAPTHHATRWGWALAMLMLSMGVLRGSTRLTGKLLDILVLGLITVSLALLNVVFLIALLPATGLGFYCNKRLKTFGLGWGLGAVFYGLIVLTQSGIVGRLDIHMNNPLTVANILGTLCLIWMPLMIYQSQKRCEAVLAGLISLGLLALTITLPLSLPYYALVIAILLGIQSRGVIVYNRWGWKMKPSLRMLAVVFLMLGLPTFYGSVASLALHALHDPAQFETVSAREDIRVLR